MANEGCIEVTKVPATELNNRVSAGHGAAPPGGSDAPVRKAWPFAPGSQLDKQVAKPWVPKPTYRFNQR